MFKSRPCRTTGARAWRARPASVVVSASTTAGFHQSRMVATERPAEPLQRLQLNIRWGQSNSTARPLCFGRDAAQRYPAALLRVEEGTGQASTFPSYACWHAPTSTCRLAESDGELQAAAWLRAQSFYVYPPERKFAGEVRQWVSCGGGWLTAQKAARNWAPLPFPAGGHKPLLALARPFCSSRV